MTDAAEGTGCYVYGVAREVDPDQVAGLRGVGGAPVRVVAQGGLVALVSPVDLAEFGEDGLRRNLETLDWLERAARAHHGVLAALTSAGTDRPLVPLRLATVYHDEERVRAVLAGRGAAFDAALSRVEGCTEWGLKACLAPQQPDAAQPRTSPQPQTQSLPRTHSQPRTPGELRTPAEAGAAAARSARPGTDYLRRRQTQLRGAEQRRAVAAEQVEAVHAAVAAVALDARRYPPQDSTLSGDSREMVLNAAYLVRGTERSALERALAAVPGSALTLEWTGPWVPYSFAELEPDR